MSGAKSDQGLDRITRDPDVVGGTPCVRGMRVTVGMLAGLVRSGVPVEEILDAYPYVEEEDVRQALRFLAPTALDPHPGGD